MASKASEPVTTPVARMVMGSLYKPRTTDNEGRPLVYKSGQNIGQPRKDFFFGIAIPKGAEVQQAYGKLNWAATPWGAAIYAAGTAFLAHAAQMKDFAWKVADGDSDELNSKGNALVNREGCKGCWVLFFSGTQAPRICNADGSMPLTEPDAIKAGYFVQVGFTAKGNDSTVKPGVYLNAIAVARSGYGEEIHTGVDTAALGFGGVALPAGASAVPLAQMGVVIPGAAVPGLPPLPGLAPVPLVAAQLPPPVATVISQTPLPVAAAQLPPPGITPNAAFLQPAPVVLRPTATAQGTYEQYKAAGYTDDQMIAAGVMTR